MNRFLILTLIVPLLIISNTANIAAHMLEEGENISVLFHIDPMDRPLTGLPAVINIEVLDPSNHFAIERCDCRFGIYKDSAAELNERITLQRIEYTFKNAGKYKIEFAGKPLKGGEFEEFKFEKEIEVFDMNKPQATAAATNSPSLVKSKNAKDYFALAGVVMAGIGVIKVLTKSRKK
jgi:hypothetical protein